MAKAYFILMIYNEEDSLRDVVKQIMSAELPPHFERRILAINDGSMDKSQEVLDELEKMYPVRTVHLKERLGMPLSFKAAFAHLKDHVEHDDLVFTMEADATNDINCVPHLAEEIRKGSDVVIASRYAPGAKSLGFPWYRLIGSRVINLFLSFMWNIPQVKDYSVLYRVYRGSVLKKYIDEDNQPFRAKKSFAVISEILLRISHYTSKFSEVPLIYDYSLKKGKSKMKLLQTLWEYTRVTPRTPLYRQPIFWIAAAAFVARLIGINFGLPDLVVFDEPALTRGALTMLNLHTLIPALHPAAFSTMYYPPVTAYLYLIVLLPVVGIGYLFSHAGSLSAYAVQLILDPTLPWLATRFASACIAALTIYCIGRVAERIYPGSGVFAALFLATSFLHTLYAHVARHWAPSFLWIVALIWSAHRIHFSGQKRWYVLSGIFSGLSLGTGVVTVIASVIPGLAHLLRPEPFIKKVLSGRLWIMIVIAAVVGGLFMALHPLVLANLLKGAGEQGTTITAPKSFAGFAEIYIAHARDLAQSETAIFIFALVGMLPLLRRHFRFGLSLALSALLSIGALYAVHYYLLHYLIIILPTLIIFAAVGAAEVVSLVKTRQMKIVLMICIFVLPMLISLQFVRLWSAHSTQQDARSYIEKNLPSDARIISQIRDIKIVWPNKQAIENRLSFDPSSSRLTDTTLLSLPQGKYPTPAFNVFEISTLSASGTKNITPEFLAGQHLQYVVVDRSLPPVPALEAEILKGEVIARFPQKGRATDLFNDAFQGPAVAVFRMTQMGPEIWIVKLQR
jgi:dolichol-phosphate mannosyltransferase